MVGEWIVDVKGIQEIYGLYGLKHHIVEISGDVTKVGRTGQTIMKDSATQLFICASLSFAITQNFQILYLGS